MENNIEENNTPTEIVLPEENVPEVDKKKEKRIAFFTILGVLAFVLVISAAIVFLSKKEEDTSGMAEAVQSIKTAISEAEDQTAAKGAVDETINNAEEKIAKNELRLSSIYLYLLGGYPALANDEAINLYSTEKLSDEELCKYYDIKYILAQNNANDFEVGYYHASRTEICENVYKNFEKQSDESDFQYAMRLHEKNFFSLANEKFEQLDFAGLSDEEKVSAYETMADYYYAIGDEDEYYKTLNKKIEIEHPISEEEYDGVKF